MKPIFECLLESETCGKSLVKGKNALWNSPISAFQSSQMNEVFCLSELCLVCKANQSLSLNAFDLDDNFVVKLCKAN